MIPDITNLPYRQCVGIVLFNTDGLVFVGERIDTPGAWQMPQGGIDPGEDISTAALRELAEEVGTDKADIIRIAAKTVKYDLPPHLLGQSSEDHEGRTLWNGKYRGQEQTWVALRFAGDDTDIRLDAHDPPEFRAYQWVPLPRTIDLIVPFKRDVYREVALLFSDI